ncbi:serine/arginine-rich SC35-like splicing factor SCL33 [Helianthus annuus]|uniref:serine/arginine-rich SC35-like splicing factor SCL33 n=1 Tax=Helianthus annuus TaxID=4232 RepID=UPI000B8F93A2|nr:serine/arginine-rich SC35-like splicing factor SCL33 [Helianthus annuus]
MSQGLIRTCLRLTRVEPEQKPGSRERSQRNLSESEAPPPPSRRRCRHRCRRCCNFCSPPRPHHPPSLLEQRPKSERGRTRSAAAHGSAVVGSPVEPEKRSGRGWVVREDKRRRVVLIGRKTGRRKSWLRSPGIAVEKERGEGIWGVADCSKCEFRVYKGA